MNEEYFLFVPNLAAVYRKDSEVFIARVLQAPLRCLTERNEDEVDEN